MSASTVRSDACARRSVSAFILAAVLLGACSGEDDSLLIDVVTATADTAPEHLLVTWFLPDDEALPERRAPETGVLPPSAQPLATIRITVDRQDTRPRKILVRGMVGERAVVIGAARVALGDGPRATVTLVATLADHDGDGLPDVIDDDCPTTGPCPLAPEGGTRDGGSGPDAAAPDTAGLDLGPEAAAADAPPGDAAWDAVASVTRRTPKPPMRSRRTWRRPTPSRSNTTPPRPMFNPWLSIGSAWWHTGASTTAQARAWPTARATAITAR